MKPTPSISFPTGLRVEIPRIEAASLLRLAKERRYAATDTYRRGGDYHLGGFSLRTGRLKPRPILEGILLAAYNLGVTEDRMIQAVKEEPEGWLCRNYHNWLRNHPQYCGPDEFPGIDVQATAA